MSDYAKYPCNCGKYSHVKMIYPTGHSDAGVKSWLCQCEGCKTIYHLDIMEYNYKTHESNIVMDVL